MQEESGLDRNKIEKLLEEEKIIHGTLLEDGYNKWRMNG